jgi:crotonobetainyl-CoA:carnitine CoA-transferase CaiB-like acyl-CoA transferase
MLVDYMAEETWKDYKKKKHSKPLPLSGIRVLEVCTLPLGPAGPGFAAEMGAEVIKCEIPPIGDTCRDLTLYWLTAGGSKGRKWPIFTLGVGG